MTSSDERDQDSLNESSRQDERTVTVSRHLNQTVDPLHDEINQIKLDVEDCISNSKANGSIDKLRQRIIDLQQTVQKKSSSPGFSEKDKTETLRTLATLFHRLIDRTRSSSSSDTERSASKRRQTNENDPDSSFSETDSSDSSDADQHRLARKLREQVVLTSTPRVKFGTESPPRKSSVSQSSHSLPNETGNKRSLRSTLDNEQGSSQPKSRPGNFPIGSLFRAVHNRIAIQPGYLNIRKGDRLELHEEFHDDTCIFFNIETQRSGKLTMESVVYCQPNRIEKQHETYDSFSSAAVALKNLKAIPFGFSGSKLKPLSQSAQYNLYSRIKPTTTESNFYFAHLIWRSDLNQLNSQPCYYQRILTIERCLKIPKVDPEQIEILNRGVRLCLSDGSMIISNIVSLRAFLSEQKPHKRTENWQFAKIKSSNRFDQVPKFLIRSDHQPLTQSLYLLIELAVACKLKSSNQRSLISSGWVKVALKDRSSAVLNRVIRYDELLHGGPLEEEIVSLDWKYQNSPIDGTFGLRNRLKRARIQFNIRFQSDRATCLSNFLPATSMIVPYYLRFLLAFFLHELAYQLFQKPVESVSTRPIESIFLSTFERFIELPDLVYVFYSRLTSRKQLSFIAQRHECLSMYDTFIYPLLNYCGLPDYDFDSLQVVNDRQTKIQSLLTRDFSIGSISQNNSGPAAYFLDQRFTDQWTPFTTDELMFSYERLFTHS